MPIDKKVSIETKVACPTREEFRRYLDWWNGRHTSTAATRWEKLDLDPSISDMYRCDGASYVDFILLPPEDNHRYADCVKMAIGTLARRTGQDPYTVYLDIVEFGGAPVVASEPPPPQSPEELTESRKAGLLRRGFCRFVLEHPAGFFDNKSGARTAIWTSVGRWRGRAFDRTAINAKLAYAIDEDDLGTMTEQDYLAAVARISFY